MLSSTMETTSGAVAKPNFQPLEDATFISLVRNYAVNTTPAPGAAYLVTNAIHLLGTIGQHIAALKPAIIAALNDAFAAHPHLSEPWLWAVEALCKLGACPTENGQIVTKEMAAAEAKRAAESGRALVESSAFSIPCVSIAWLNTEGRFRRRV